MSRVKVQMNHDVARAFLKSAVVGGLVKREADQIAARAGDGFASSTWVGDTRVIASVETESVQAIRRNARDNTLIRALRGGKK